MSIIDRLLTNVRLPPPISELPSDIEEVPCKYDPGRLCLQCKKCGSVSGTSREISHFFGCQYKPPEHAPAPYVMGVRRPPSKRINPELCECILQKEYAIISNNSVKTIVGTYGALPCIILCMRDRRNTNTILAHIDATTENPLEPFLSFPPEHSDVYMIGGTDGSRKDATGLLFGLKSGGYTLTFAHIIDDDSNAFAIDCLTGETWLNHEISMRDLPIAIDKGLREGRMIAVALGSGPLVSVKIPNKPAGAGAGAGATTAGGKRKNRRNTKRNYRKRRQTFRKH